MRTIFILISILFIFAFSKISYASNVNNSNIKNDLANNQTRTLTALPILTASAKVSLPLSRFKLQKINNQTNQSSQNANTRALGELVSPNVFQGLGGLESAGLVNDPIYLHLAISEQYIIQTTPKHFAIYDKAGTKLTQTINREALWEGIGGLCSQFGAEGDKPLLTNYNHIVHDPMEDRWVFTFSSKELNDKKTSFCIAISESNDPFGRYFLYDYSMQLTDTGESSQHELYTSSKAIMHAERESYYLGTGSTIRKTAFNSHFVNFFIAVEKGKMLQGKPARFVLYQQREQDNFNTSVPLSVAGSIPPTEKQFFATLTEFIDIKFHQMTVDWQNPNNNKLEEDVMGLQLDNIAETFFPDQPNSISLSLTRFDIFPIYRNIAGKEKVVFSTRTFAGVPGSNPSLNLLKFQLVEFNTSLMKVNNEKSIDITDGVNNFVGGAGTLDAQGNFIVSYTKSGGSQHPSHYAKGSATIAGVEITSDIDFQLGQGSLASDSGSRFVSFQGDHIPLLDPSDDCHLYRTGMYMKAADDDTVNWSSFIGKTKLDGCVANTEATIQGKVTDTANHPIKHARVIVGRRSTITDTNGNYQLQLQAGNYQVHASKYFYADSSTQNVTLSTGDTTNLNLTLADSTDKVTINGNISTSYSPYGQVWIKGPGQTEYQSMGFTHPETGNFQLSLVNDAAVSIKVSAANNQGYTDNTQTIIATGTLPTLDIDLTQDDSCTAKGYQDISGSCTAISGSMVSAYIVDAQDRAVNGVEIRNPADNSVLAVSSTTPNDGNINDGFVYAFIPNTVTSVIVSDPSGTHPTISVPVSRLALSTPIQLSLPDLSQTFTALTNELNITIIKDAKASYSINLLNTSSTPVNFQITTTPSNSSWAVMTPANGTIFNNIDNGLMTINIDIDTNGLQAGKTNMIVNVAALNSTTVLNIPVTITVNEPELGSVSFEASTITLANPQERNIKVVMASGSSNDNNSSVDYRILDIANNEQEITYGTLNWPAQDTSVKIITLPESDSSLKVQLMNPQGLSLGSIATTIVQTNTPEVALPSGRTSGAAMGFNTLLLLCLFLLLKAYKTMRLKPVLII